MFPTYGHECFKVSPRPYAASETMRPETLETLDGFLSGLGYLA